MSSSPRDRYVSHSLSPPHPSVCARRPCDAPPEPIVAARPQPPAITTGRHGASVTTDPCPAFRTESGIGPLAAARISGIIKPTRRHVTLEMHARSVKPGLEDATPQPEAAP